MRKIFKILFALVLVILISISEVAAKPYYYDDYSHYDKVIKINTFANKLSYYEKGEKIGQMDISSGDGENYTPRGRFRITNKNERMLSSSAGKWMPYWMEFWDGVYGIHALPEDYNGNLDTSSTIGEVAAGGCVRLTKDDATKLYEWVELGTVVLIDYDKNEYADSDRDKNTIEEYFKLISEEKYEEAFDMRLNRAYSLNTFIGLYKGYITKVEEIKEINGGEYQVTTKIFKGETYVGTSISKFFISDGKIIRSFVIKRY